jgi:hypothetical protein
MVCIVAPSTNKPGNDRLSSNGHNKTGEQVLKYLDSVHLIALSIVPSGKVGEARQLRIAGHKTGKPKMSGCSLNH